MFFTLQGAQVLALQSVGNELLQSELLIDPLAAILWAASEIVGKARPGNLFGHGWALEADHLPSP